MPNSFLQKPISVSVAGTLEEDKSTPVEIFSIHLWLGWLGRAHVEQLSFVEDLEADFRLVDKDSQTPCAPHAEALAAVAAEKFSVRPPGEEDLPNGGPAPLPEAQRLSQLESKRSSKRA